ncbi:DM13 domain-containing protein [Herpetosiphon geysericola]|uniref:DM13 domain-containing protein n=1 Tax=Herpetosiphon geysericola TaxID=70996 RepID=A0A0P6YJS1_9CHLR|nr:DM13 domain-containing protein [Herpetosiphon geysericola]KPL85396.1 hypothetical protein SE18_17240 [Herpetosiphon geysericola]
MKLRSFAMLLLLGGLAACGTAPTTIDEPFPTTSSAPMATTQPTVDSMMQPTEPMSMTDDMMQPTEPMSMTDESMTDDMMQPSDPMPMTDDMIEPTMMPTAESRVEPSAVPAEPVMLSSGAFRGIDHESRGMAKLYKQPDGSIILRLNDFYVEPGPDMYIFVAKAADIHQPSDLQAGYLELSKLKGSEGNQNYNLPNDFDPALYNNVVIWCEKYQVLMAVAPIQ